MGPATSSPGPADSLSQASGHDRAGAAGRSCLCIPRPAPAFPGALLGFACRSGCRGACKLRVLPPSPPRWPLRWGLRGHPRGTLSKSKPPVMTAEASLEELGALGALKKVVLLTAGHRHETWCRGVRDVNAVTASSSISHFVTQMLPFS